MKKSTKQSFQEFAVQLKAELIEKLNHVPSETVKDQTGYGYDTLRAFDHLATAEQLIGKFTQRWEQAPEWVTFLQQGEIEIIVLGPIPTKEATS